MSNQNYGKKASVKWASDDDAGDLLASILNDTETDAALEQQRIEAEVKARQEEAQRLKDAEEQHRIAEAEARISAEMDRLQQVEVRRTQKLEALKIEDLKESGLWQPPVDPAETERARLAEEQARAAAFAAQNQHAPTPENTHAAAQTTQQAAPLPVAQKSNSKALAILGIVTALVVISGGIAFMLMQGSYKVDNTAFAKAVYSPKENQVLLVEKGFAPIPKPEPVAETPAPAAPTRSTSRSRPSTAKSTPAKTAPAKKAAPKKKIELDLDFDPFKSGF